MPHLSGEPGVQTDPQGLELHPYFRWMLGLMGVGLLVPLALACWLTPSVRGQGTHQQLGLPPCTFVALYNMPCPSCGMTTSWAHTVRGELPSAVRANLGGTLLAIAAIVFAPWMIGSAVRGHKLTRFPSEGQFISGAAVVIAVTLVQWMIKIYPSHFGG